MLNRLAIMFIAHCFIFAGTAGAKEKKWICSANLSSVFSYTNEKMVETKFKLKDQDFTIAVEEVDLKFRKDKDNSPLAYFSIPKGQETGTLCNSIKPKNYKLSFCNSPRKFTIHLRKLRYIVTTTNSFVDDNNIHTPHIETGKCSPL